MPHKLTPLVFCHLHDEASLTSHSLSGTLTWPETLIHVNILPEFILAYIWDTHFLVSVFYFIFFYCRFSLKYLKKTILIVYFALILHHFRYICVWPSWYIVRNVLILWPLFLPIKSNPFWYTNCPYKNVLMKTHGPIK